MSSNNSNLNLCSETFNLSDKIIGTRKVQLGELKILELGVMVI